MFAFNFLPLLLPRQYERKELFLFSSVRGGIQKGSETIPSLWHFRSFIAARGHNSTHTCRPVGVVSYRKPCDLHGKLVPIQEGHQDCLISGYGSQTLALRFVTKSAIQAPPKLECCIVLEISD